MTGPESIAPDEAARVATPADLAVVAALASNLRAQLTAERGGPLWAAHDALPSPTAASLRDRLDHPEQLTIVGTLDDHVLAYGLAHTEAIADGTGRLGVIDELFVAEPARAVSLGATVLAALVAWCTDARCIGIDATALPGDRLAKNFFEAAGFKARRLVMHKPVT